MPWVVRLCRRWMKSLIFSNLAFSRVDRSIIQVLLMTLRKSFRTARHSTLTSIAHIARCSSRMSDLTFVRTFVYSTVVVIMQDHVRNFIRSQFCGYHVNDSTCIPLLPETDLGTSEAFVTWTTWYSCSLDGHLQSRYFLCVLCSMIFANVRFLVPEWWYVIIFRKYRPTGYCTSKYDLTSMLQLSALSSVLSLSRSGQHKCRFGLSF